MNLGFQNARVPEINEVTRELFSIYRPEITPHSLHSNRDGRRKKIPFPFNHLESKQ